MSFSHHIHVFLCLLVEMSIMVTSSETTKSFLASFLLVTLSDYSKAKSIYSSSSTSSFSISNSSFSSRISSSSMSIASKFFTVTLQQTWNHLSVIPVLEVMFVRRHKIRVLGELFSFFISKLWSNLIENNLSNVMYYEIFSVFHLFFL